MKAPGVALICKKKPERRVFETAQPFRFEMNKPRGHLPAIEILASGEKEPPTVQSDHLLKALTNLEQAIEHDPITFINVGLDALGSAAMAGPMGFVAPELARPIKQALANATPLLVEAVRGQIPDHEVRHAMAVAADLFDIDDGLAEERLFVLGLLKLELTRLVILGEIHARGRRIDMSSISALCGNKPVSDDSRSFH